MYRETTFTFCSACLSLILNIVILYIIPYGEKHLLSSFLLFRLKFPFVSLFIGILRSGCSREASQFSSCLGFFQESCFTLSQLWNRQETNFLPTFSLQIFKLLALAQLCWQHQHSQIIMGPSHCALHTYLPPPPGYLTGGSNPWRKLKDRQALLEGKSKPSSCEASHTTCWLEF